MTSATALTRAPSGAVERVGPQLVRPIARPSEVIEAHKEVAELIRNALEEGRDYGKIPGTDKDCLLKAGAERLAIAFGTRPEYEIVEAQIEHDRVTELQSGWVAAEDPGREEKERRKALKIGRNKKVNGEWEWQERGEGTTKIVGLYRYVVRCKLVRHDGSIVADHVAACSTLETKYIDRPRDCEHVVLQMAQKRAFVGAVLNGFGLSDRFTRDGEDLGDAPAPRAAPQVPSTPDGQMAELRKKIGAELDRLGVVGDDARANAVAGCNSGRRPRTVDELLEVLSILCATQAQKAGEQ